MYKEKVKFRKYNGEITKMLKQKFPKANDFEFADKCAVAISQGVDPINVYLDNKGMFMANGGTCAESTEIFSEVMKCMKEPNRITF